MSRIPLMHALGTGNLVSCILASIFHSILLDQIVFQTWFLKIFKILTQNIKDLDDFALKAGKNTIFVGI